MTLLRIGETDLYTEDSGTGEPVLLLHGGFCSLESLRHQTEALAPDHRVIAFERPGHGRSADIDGEYSYERGVAEALAVLDAQGVEAAHVIGYSDGAIIGLLLARDQPHRVRSLVSISANLDPSAFTHSAEAAGAVVLDERARSTRSETVTAASAAASESGGGGGSDRDPSTEPDVERAHYDRLSPDGPQHAEIVLGKLLRLWTSQPRIDPASLASVAAPVLVMSGDRDTIRPDHSLLIAASIPGARLCIVPGASHGLVAERPAFIAREIREFLHPA